jgi:hypothetical protein
MTTTAAPYLSVISSLILVRLLAAGEKGDTVAKIKKDLVPLLAHRWEGAALTERINQTLGELESTGLVTLARGKSKKSVARAVLTAAGQQWGLDFLGVAELRPKTTWGLLKKTYLPARALGMSASSDVLFKALSSEPAFQAVLLKRQFSLRTADIPKPDEATDALAWKLIGFDGEAGKFTPKNVKMLIFNRALGDGHATEGCHSASSTAWVRSRRSRRGAGGWIDERSDGGLPHRLRHLTRA